jgi:hypothetical protein
LVDEIVVSSPYIEGRGGFFCRGCLGKDLFSALDLGDLPIANELLLSSEGDTEKFPLHLKICRDCGLGQVADVVTPERIFRDYRYLSSLSSTFLKHASDFVSEQVESNTFTSQDWVLEIASNDGYLLKNFIPYGIKVVGVEPAENVAATSRSLGIETISEFFSSQLAKELLARFGYPKMIIANNVMAHVPDLVDFIRGLQTLCGPATQISIENPTLSNILVGMQFDTIYHEHYSYLSATTVSELSKRNGLQLFRVEELTIHGGSNRYWLRAFSPNSPVDSSVESLILDEKSKGLFELANWKSYSIKVSDVLKALHAWLSNQAEKGNRVYGYGAAAKASTLLNSIDVQADFILAIADASQEKQNRYMPPNGIKIISPMQLFEQKPSDILIFPWNIKSEIAIYLNQNLGPDVRFWCAIPEMHQVEI